MVRSETVVVLFVASPSDVEDERSKLDGVVAELNRTWSKTLGVRIELIGWETHTYPGVGSSAQDVINCQIGDDYDIFVGIMWGRFGSPTKNAGSGTEEEFNRAWQRHSANPNLRIMFYFKDAAMPPSKMDPDQLTKIRKFKARLGNEGVYYWSFQSADDFVNLLRTHLARQVQEHQKRLAHDAPSAVVVVGKPPPTDAASGGSEDDLGMLDLLEVFEERFAVVREIVGRIGAASSELGSRLNQRTEETRQAVDLSGGALSTAEAKALVNRAADDMDQYVKRASVEIPMLREAMRDGVRALGMVASMATSVDDEEARRSAEGRQAVVALEESLSEAQESIAGFMDTVRGMPRMTTMLNRAKSRTLQALDDLQQVLSDGRRDAAEARKVLDQIAGESDS